MKGLAKLAQIADETEVVSPEKPMNNEETTITCLSDCIYAQNPEKTCMLKNVSLNMSKTAMFECGQYTPAASEVPETQEESQPSTTGLDKVKN